MKLSSFVFFTLLQESFKVDAEIRLTEMTVVSIPHMDKESQNSTIEGFKQQSSDVLELLDDTNISSIEEIKSALGQK